MAPIFKWLGHGNHSNNKKLNPIINLFLVRIKKKEERDALVIGSCCNTDGADSQACGAQIE